ncbi:O-antigen ligase family protein [Maribacter sp. MMG018]|uniref:O-antigen ligase family protein n=1 Tax=Maribacter sp. MMG018 TaxID=2822688 RepID=UPI001B38F4C5|nr:O-antigen ligase family protein [Maribacter sp. MMG018]MBQ4915641.1 O-antigen ligase family protein [Maribacter sp. MMG018]
MLLKAVRYFTLFLIMLNFPDWVLVNFNQTISSALSYLSFGLMLLYFVMAKKWNLNGGMVLLGATYFGISSLSGQEYMPEFLTYTIVVIKYFIIVIAGYSVIQDTTKNEMFVFLLLGATTVFLQMFVFYNPLKDYGRYSGFYLNPNSLGFICMMGYGLTYGLQKKWRTLGQIAFTFIGFLTFSRTFIIVWLFMNLLSIRLSIKNIRVLAIGLGLFISLLIFNSFLPKSNPRLEAMSNILQGKSNNTGKLEEDSRTQTWAIYYPALMEKPVFGNGYNAFAGGAKVSPVGPHNSYIKIMGEGGIFSLLILLILYGLLLKNSWINFIEKPSLFLMTFSLCLYLLTNHNFFDSGYILFFTMWLQYEILKKSSQINVEKE